MDMSGAPPHEAWVEIHDDDGELLAKIPAEVEGGSIAAKLPAFPPGTYGSVQLCEDYGDSIERRDADRRELPTNPHFMRVQIG